MERQDGAWYRQLDANLHPSYFVCALLLSISLSLSPFLSHSLVLSGTFLDRFALLTGYI